MGTIDEEWTNFLIHERMIKEGMFIEKEPIPVKKEPTSLQGVDIPLCDDLYISTNTKILYLNQMIDTYKIFWKIPIIEYWQPRSGVVHKNMKIVSLNEEQLEDCKKHLENIPFYQENIIKQINVTNSKKTKFKDERKIMIGVSKKEIINTRKRQKKAFMNCFSIIIRFPYDRLFREIHVKIFNTGNLEIPGIQSVELLTIVKKMVIDLLQPYTTEPLEYVEREGKSKSVLINSNFRCGFYIERENLYTILREKYGIDASYDPCSYPGVKCKFYFNNENGFDELLQNGTIHIADRNMTMTELGKNTKYTEVTFTVFRTGSCLISGNCTEEMLVYIYNFVKNILKNEYHNICANTITPALKEKHLKLRKKTITMTPEYYASIYPASM